MKKYIVPTAMITALGLAAIMFTMIHRMWR